MKPEGAAAAATATDIDRGKHGCPMSVDQAKRDRQPSERVTNGVDDFHALKF
jgi:hypothetical protein